jgi:hypothetical protein
MAQRNLSLADVLYVLEHGECLHRTGITIYILRKRDIPQKDRKVSEIMRLEGTVVLTGLSQDGNLDVITMYRNKIASRTIRCKKKYDKRRRYRTNRNLPAGIG